MNRLQEYKEYWQVVDNNNCLPIPDIKRSWFNLQIVYDVNGVYNLIDWQVNKVICENLDCSKEDNLPLLLVALREYLS